LVNVILLSVVAPSLVGGEGIKLIC
jgi:hypothetical protein